MPGQVQNASIWLHLAFSNLLRQEVNFFHSCFLWQLLVTRWLPLRDAVWCGRLKSERLSWWPRLVAWACLACRKMRIDLVVILGSHLP